MGRLGAKLRSVENGIGWWCPGCKSFHRIWTGAGQWTWNGDVEKPTIAPSIMNSQPASDGRPAKVLCHCFVANGQIQFLPDCAHELKGQTVDMPDWPYADGEYGGA
jgi:uncharacterized protein DUF6527